MVMALLFERASLTQPVMERFGIPATVRASFGMYSTHEEVDRLVEGKKRLGCFVMENCGTISTGYLGS